MHTSTYCSVHGTPAVRAHTVGNEGKIAVEFRDVEGSSAFAIIDDPHTLAAILTEAVEAVDRCYRTQDEATPTTVTVPIELLIHLAAPPAGQHSPDVTQHKALTRLRVLGFDEQTLTTVRRACDSFPVAS